MEVGGEGRDDGGAEGAVDVEMEIEEGRAGHGESVEENVSSIPRLRLVLQDIQRSTYQDVGCCSNCFISILDGDGGGKKLWEPIGLRRLQRKSGDGGDGQTVDVTVMEALDVVFEVKKKSCFSRIILDEEGYALCMDCFQLLAKLYKIFFEFERKSQVPSFMKSIFVQNTSLRLYQDAALKELSDGDGDDFEDDYLWDFEVVEELQVQDTKYYPAPVQVWKEEREDEASNYSEGGGNEDWSAEFAGHASDSADEAGAESSSLRPSRRPGLRRNPPSKFKKPFRKRIQKKNKTKDTHSKSSKREMQGQSKKNPRKYKCSECVAKFSRSNHLADHMVIHSEKNFFCDSCNGGFKTESFLNRHVKAFHTLEEKYAVAASSPSAKKCHKKSSKLFRSKSGSIYKTKSVLKRRHEEELRHGKDSDSDPDFVPEADLESDHDQIQNQDEDDQDYEIGASPAESDTEGSSTKAKTKSRRRYKCKKCQATFLRTDHVRRHVLVHTEDTTNYCEACSAGFKSFSLLQRHLISVHPKNRDKKRKYECTHEGCDVTFSRSTYLKAHIDRKHPKKNADGTVRVEEVFPKACFICGLILRSEFKLNKHLSKAHRPTILERNFTCEICGRSYENKDTLRKHTVSHRTDRILFCEVEGCKYTTNYRCLLSRHNTLVHIGRRDHLCNTCGMAFKSLHQLKLHTVRHRESEVRPFPCTHPGCTKAFKRQTNLHQHLQIHKGAKFTCESCGATFSRLGYLKVHRDAVHLGIRKESPTKPKRSSTSTGRVRRTKNTEIDSTNSGDGDDGSSIVYAATEVRVPPQAHQVLQHPQFIQLQQHHFVQIPSAYSDLMF